MESPRVAPGARSRSIVLAGDRDSQPQSQLGTSQWQAGDAGDASKPAGAALPSASQHHGGKHGAGAGAGGTEAAAGASPCLHTQTRGCCCEQPGHASLGGAARLFRELSAPPREVSDAFIYKPAGSCPATSSSHAGKSPAEPRQTEPAASLRGRRRCRPGQGCSSPNARPWGPKKSAWRCPCPARGAVGPVPIHTPNWCRGSSAPHARHRWRCARSRRKPCGSHRKSELRGLEVRAQPYPGGAKGLPGYPSTSSDPWQRGHNRVIVSMPPGTRVCRGIKQTPHFPLAALAFPIPANPPSCPVSTAPFARRGRWLLPSPPRVQWQRCSGGTGACSGPQVGAGSEGTGGDSAHRVLLPGGSWNNKVHHPK